MEMTKLNVQPFQRDKHNDIVINAVTGMPEPNEGYFVDGKMKKETHKKFMNEMVGFYVLRDYTFIESSIDDNSALFYHHADNKLQDDIVFVKAKLAKDGIVSDDRMIVPRKQLLKIAEALQDG